MQQCNAELKMWRFALGARIWTTVYSIVCCMLGYRRTDIQGQPFLPCDSLSGFEPESQLLKITQRLINKEIHRYVSWLKGSIGDKTEWERQRKDGYKLSTNKLNQSINKRITANITIKKWKEMKHK